MFLSKKGFTIIELIVVIAIIAVLATIVTGFVFNYNTKSKVVATKAEVGEIAKAVLLYKTQNGCFPDPRDCSGSCSCLNPDEEVLAFGDIKNNSGISFTKVFDSVLPVAYAAGGCTGGDVLTCSSGTCMCEPGEEADPLCSGLSENDPCGSSSSSSSSSSSGGGGVGGEGAALINALVGQKFLGGGTSVTTDAWGRDYGFVFNLQVNGARCSFVYSNGANGQPEITTENLDGISCDQYFEGDDVWALIESRSN